MVGTPSQIPKHSNKSSFGIVSHLACYARVGPDGDSHGEWEKKKRVGIGTTSKESRQCHNTPICKKLALSFRTQLMVNQTFLT